MIGDVEVADQTRRNGAAAGLDAPRFVEGTTTIIFDGAADLRRAPVPDALLDTEPLHGEIFVEYD